MRSLPAFEFRIVTARARLRPHESGSARGYRRSGRAAASIGAMPPMNRDRRNCDDRQRNRIDRPPLARWSDQGPRGNDAPAIRAPFFPLRHEVGLTDAGRTNLQRRILLVRLASRTSLEVVLRVLAGLEKRLKAAFTLLHF